MTRRLATATATLLLAAGSLAACAGPKASSATPQLDSISATEARTMAGQFCDDLGNMAYDKAISRMAVRASESNLSDGDQDAVLEMAARQCPDELP